jgi:hypothetical protein
MKPDVVSKLERHLQGNIDSECKVVYLLCEVRKLLLDEPKPFTLNFYCNWAMHVDLDRKPTTIEFLKTVDAYIINKLESDESTETIHQEDALLREFVSLQTFRRQLADFLNSHGLPTQICDQNHRWFSFMSAYSGLIEDGSIACKGEAPELKMVSKIIFSKGKLSADSHGELSFRVDWRVHLQDGRALRIEAEADPAVTALSFKFTLLPSSS